MAAINKDARRHIVNLVSGDTARELAIVMAPANRLARRTFETLSDYQIDHGPLLIFGVVAIVLFGFLFRS